MGIDFEGNWKEMTSEEKMACCENLKGKLDTKSVRELIWIALSSLEALTEINHERLDEHGERLGELEKAIVRIDQQVSFNKEGKIE